MESATAGGSVYAALQGKYSNAGVHSKMGLGTIGLSSARGGADRTSLAQPAIAVRTSARAIASAGGTLPKVIEGLIEAAHANNTMDVRERAAAALHSLAEQAREPADIIGRDGMQPLIVLLQNGSPDAQAHAAAALRGVTKASREYQVRGVPHAAAAAHTHTRTCNEER